ncbi:MAG: MFS transporter [Anaerolineae bacterium]|nr:MFS transporter [Anaerolineae bacterium]
MQREVGYAVLWGLITSFTLAILILIGSRNLAHFDAALVAYTASILFATFGLTYRYTMWLQRPPTAIYWKRGWQVFLNPKYLGRNMVNWFRHVTEDIALNRFIFERSRMRGLTHFLIMWGCIIAIGITFPLVFGWLHFESVSGEIDTYQAYVFGFPTFTFPSGSLFGFLIFHGLVWAAFITITGVMLAMRRRMREEGAAALQLFVEDFLPLILLFAVSITGLMLTASYTWLKGYAYDFIAILHAITVIITFLWLPFGKFFHIFQRPAQIGVRFYKYVGEREAPAICRRCNTPFTSLMHVQDLITTEKQLGYDYEMPGTAVEHYQWICPRCRRAMLALAQGQLWRMQLGGEMPASIPYTPSPPDYVNPGIGEGPLGHEDANNFHP